MTLVQLTRLIAQAESGSFSRSAQAMFVTQPALVRSIRALEDELGQPLFDRVGRRSELTTFGREAVQRARQLVLDAPGEELPSLVDAARHSDAVLLAIRAAAPDRVELVLTPALAATALFGLVTRAGRAEAPALPIVRRLIDDLLHDGPRRSRPSMCGWRRRPGRRTLATPPPHRCEVPR